MEMVGVGMVAEVEAVEEAVVVFVGMEEATVVGICNKNLVFIMTMVEVLLLLKAVVSFYILCYCKSIFSKYIYQKKNKKLTLISNTNILSYCRVQLPCWSFECL